MSRTFSTKCGSADSLNVSARCGCRPKAPQMRQMVVCDSPASFAIERSDQWVASAGVVISVRSITPATCLSSMVRGRPGRGSVEIPYYVLEDETRGLDPVRDIQVLCPMNRGGAGARSLNIELQATLNPAGERKVERFGWTFAPGDKVTQIENDYDKEVYTRIRLVADFAARCRREDAPRSVHFQFVVLDHRRLDDAGV